METYLRAAGSDSALARELYVWNRDLSVAILADIAVIEVALRNAMHEALTYQWGDHWYEGSDPVLDLRSAGQLKTAWERLPRRRLRDRADPDLPGRLIANCMFGFWANLLDAGGPIGTGPRSGITADYDQLWLVLRRAFKGGRAEARVANEPYRRPWVHSVVKEVNDLRNRTAHHEPLINGFPLTGQQRRKTATEGHAACMRLARMLDSDLASWLAASSTVPALLAVKPSALRQSHRCISSPHALVSGYPDF